MDPRAAAGADRDRRALPWSRALLMLVIGVAVPGCMSSCDPAVVPMPEGFDAITFNIDTGEVIRRGATEFGPKILVYRGTTPIELSDRDPKKFRSYYEKCEDESLCDEVSYNFEMAEGDYQLTLVRFGAPVLSGRINRQAGAASTDRCDSYKALARDLWGEPDDTELEGQMEVFEINDRYWGALMCGDFATANLFVGRKKRIQEMVTY